VRMWRCGREITLVIPKRRELCDGVGQVFIRQPFHIGQGRARAWYLSQAGGPPPLCGQEKYFDDSVPMVPYRGERKLWSGRRSDAVLSPGDTVRCPEKAIGGGVQVVDGFLAAQVASSMRRFLLQDRIF